MKAQFTTHKLLKKNIFYQIRLALIQSNSATMVELSQMLDISFPTISKFITEMKRKGEVLELGFDESSGGRRAKRYSLNADYAYGFVVYLEKNELTFAIFNCFGHVIETGKKQIILKENGLTALTECIKNHLHQYSNIFSITIGVPGAVDNGTVFFIPDYEEFQHMNLKEYYEEMFSVPVIVENDMNAAVLGYSSKNDLEKKDSIVYIYLGQNGPGAGIMVNGDVIRGNTFFSGEVSFVPQGNKKNFGEALRLEKIGAISKLVASITAIINPHTIIFTNEEVDEDMLEQIKAQSGTLVPKQHIAKLHISDLEQDYLGGLQSIGLEPILLGEVVQHED